MNIVKELEAQGPYIRFELGLQHLYGEAYRYESLRRARILYQSIFDPEDDVMFIHRTSYERNEKRIRKLRLKRFFRARWQHARLCIIPYEFDETDDELYTKEWSIEVKAKVIRMSYTLESIENMDFLRKPRADGRIYLYNKTKSILFHMYDDRGCDVFSTQMETLLPLYHLHRKWILEYNRYEIDNLFGEGLAGLSETDDERKARWEVNDKKVMDSEINLGSKNTCYVHHHFTIPLANAEAFIQEMAFTSFMLEQISQSDMEVEFTALQVQALALIDSQTHLMSMYGKKYGTYEGWSIVD